MNLSNQILTTDCTDITDDGFGRVGFIRGIRAIRGYSVFMNRFISRVVLASLFAVFGLVAHAADPAIDAVLRADQARLAAMMAGDGAALARLMSDELRFVHSDGRIETKAAYVKNMLAGDTAYADAKTFGIETLKPSADVVIVIGSQGMRKRLGPMWSEIQLRYLAVWRNENGTWRMYAWQSMRPSGNSVVPKK